MCGGERIKMRIHDDFVAVAHTVEQPYFTIRLLLNAGIEHTHHWGDPNAPGYERNRGVAAVDVKMAGWCFDRQGASGQNLIVEESRGAAGRIICSGRRRNSLDGYPIVGLARCIRQGVAADDLMRGSFLRRNIEPECQKLPGAEARQRSGHAIGGLKVEGAN